MYYKINKNVHSEINSYVKYKKLNNSCKFFNIKDNVKCNNQPKDICTIYYIGDNSSTCSE
jgi:hypothetical protein